MTERTREYGRGGRAREPRKWARALALLSAAVLGASVFSPPVRADGSAVIEFKYTPVARAQVAIWIEDPSGKFLATVALTESVAYRGIGNRPGASQMNSGYRWPYGRREGVLPIWAHRRAKAPGAKQFGRVIFQKRIEGYASQTTSDQSKDDYYCLQFDQARSTKDQLDAVSCATQFHSDKGRYMTEADVAAKYSEPWEVRDMKTGAIRGETRAMPLFSVYPPRMDSVRCTTTSACFDHPDVDEFAADVREVMPEIDAITRATPPGDTPQRILFTVPKSWGEGDYVAWVEINVEGDYTDEQGTREQKMLGWNELTYPTPTTPTSPQQWDSWATGYGYPYRGQPSVAFKVPFTLGGVGEKATYSDMPVGRSSWEHWAEDYGKLEPITFTATDASHMADQNGSGADRLRRDGQGHRLVVTARVMSEFGPATEMPPEPMTDGGVDEPEPDAGEMTDPPDEPGVETPSEDGPVGPILDLRLRQHPNELRAHTWVNLRFRAARSEVPLHEYQVRVATQPIVDEASFLRAGRQAKNATDDVEGATALMLPVDVPEGDLITGTIGDLIADTRYYVAVRATDELNRHGPIAVAEITTPRRVFSTVTPCFIATAAYGTPLAAEIDVLRRFRDRYLNATAPGRALVSTYESYGPSAAHVIEGSDDLRAFVRGLLTPIVALARLLP